MWYFILNVSFTAAHICFQVFWRKIILASRSTLIAVSNCFIHYLYPFIDIKYMWSTIQPYTFDQYYNSNLCLMSESKQVHLILCYTGIINRQCWRGSPCVSSSQSTASIQVTAPPTASTVQSQGIQCLTH